MNVFLQELLTERKIQNSHIKDEHNIKTESQTKWFSAKLSRCTSELYYIYPDQKQSYQDLNCLPTQLSVLL